jgi:hypothetical protein
MGLADSRTPDMNHRGRARDSSLIRCSPATTPPRADGLAVITGLIRTRVVPVCAAHLRLLPALGPSLARSRGHCFNFEPTNRTRPGTPLPAPQQRWGLGGGFRVVADSLAGAAIHAGYWCPISTWPLPVGEFPQLFRGLLGGGLLSLLNSTDSPHWQSCLSASVRLLRATSSHRRSLGSHPLALQWCDRQMTSARAGSD